MKRRKICIRIDDVCECMDWDKYTRFTDILDKYNVKPLIGIVPSCRDDKLNVNSKRADYAQYIADRIANGWCVAMHGYEHRYVTKEGGIFPLNNYSEYAGCDRETQYQKISEGKRILEKQGIVTDIFMAPAHSFDDNTIDVLLQCGFRYITDGYGNGPYSTGEMIFLPISFLKKLERMLYGGVTTFVVHTATMDDKQYEYYEKLFKNERERIVDYSYMLSLKPAKRGLIGRFIEKVLVHLKKVAAR